jgi:outer membrane receptor for Fe3+-dicitrate
MKVTGLVSILLCLAACATQPPTGVAGKKEAEVDRNCLRDTGTRIKNHRGCVAGRVYTAEELDATGAQTINDALRRLPGR